MLFTDWPCVLEYSVTNKLERFTPIKFAYQRVVSKYVASWRGIGTDDSRQQCQEVHDQNCCSVRVYAERYQGTCSPIYPLSAGQ